MVDFNDLENDIAGDWLDIQKRIQDEEIKEEELNSPKRLHCRYKDFYKLIYQIAYEDRMDLERSTALHEILRMVLSGSDRMPIGFERIWDVFCDSYRNHVSEIECMSCGEKYDILYKRERRPMVSYELGAGFADEITMRYESIYCPKCSRVIGKLEEGHFINITKQYP